jgi:MFS family permease
MPGHRLSGDFWRFWTGQTISNLGSSFTFLALPLIVFKLTGSAISLAITTTAYFAPYLLFGLVIGAWVDRVDRKRMMIAVDLGRAAVIASIPALAAVDALSVWWIYAATFLTATLTIAFDSGEFAAIPSLVDRDDLVTANGRIQASYQTAQFVGPILAGSLLGAGLPIQDVLVVDAASFVVSAAALGIVRGSFNAPAAPGREPTSLRRDVAEGLRYVLSHPVLRNISLMMALFNFVAATTLAQLVLFAKERLDASDSRVGFLYSAGSAGIVVLSLLAGRIRRKLSFSVAALGALMLYGVLTFVFAWTDYYWLALPLWAAISGLGLFFNINTISLRQEIVPSHMLGRVVSIAGVLAWSAIPLGTLLGGWAIEATGNVALVYAVIGVLSFLIAFSFRFTALGHAEDFIEKPAEAQAEPELQPAR